MGRGPWWPDTRRPLLIAPTLDATSGRSYGQSSQTPGALGGRRAVQRWYTDGAVSGSNISHQIVKASGGAWRLLAASARLRVSHISNALNVDIQAKVPGSSYASVFDSVIVIPAGFTEATIGTLDVSRLYPIGTFFRILYISGGGGMDLTVELHYRVKAVSQ